MTAKLLLPITIWVFFGRVKYKAGKLTGGVAQFLLIAAKSQPKIPGRRI